jgi:ribonuclease J
MQSFFQVAQQTDRALVINLKQAYLLELFKASGIATPRIDDDHIRVHIPRKTWGVWKDDRFSEKIQREDYDYWEREFLDHANAVSARDIRENQDDYIFRCDFFELKELIDVKPDAGSCYIRSVCEPFDIEMELDLKKAENWLTHFGLYLYTQIHASGHLNYDEIRDVIETVQPKTLIPVHTQHPEVFQSLHDNVIIPEKGREIVL